jgi:uncharacterized protein YkwD
MRLLFFIIILFSQTVTAQVLRVKNLHNISNDEKQQIEIALQASKRIYITSSEIDSILFDKINQYRISKNVIALKYSERLDTLAYRVAYLNAVHHDRATHYTHLDNFHHDDLLNAENLYYGMSLVSDLKTGIRFIDVNEYLMSWIKSVEHNKILLTNLTEGSCKVVFEISMIENMIKIEEYVVFEIDSDVSKKELADKFITINKQISHANN